MDFLFNFLTQAGLDASSPLSVLWFIFRWGGFVFVGWAIVFGFKEIWVNWRQGKYAAKQEWVYLAIDVPKNNEQSFKAVEQIFTNMWGAIRGPDFWDKYWTGYFQPSFSLELVSIEGYIQYIICSPKIFQDLVEAAVYAQYPESQITEIEDYTQGIDPETFKEKGYDLWASQFGLVNDEAYPIKTYPLFEHQMSQLTVDPLASVLEIFSRMGKGEQAWYQIIVKPVKDDWKEKSEAKVKDLIGSPVDKPKLGIIDRALDVPGRWATQIGDNLFIPAGGKEEGKEEKMVVPSKMLYLSPGERIAVEAIDRKSDKPGFVCKIRYVYLARNVQLIKTKGVSGFVGALKQYSLLNSNGFYAIAITKTAVKWYQKLYKKYGDKVIAKIQKKTLANYKFRSSWRGAGGEGFILNTEELASLYHFPLINVVAPTVKTIEAKRGEAPMGLPVETDEVESVEVSEERKTVAPPSNLPI
ncbi:hypothetical protein KKC16_02810 [Patescibacteria group bacterium]|nr:hypothetical protein [Patescibacteria group bacterium]